MLILPWMLFSYPSFSYQRSVSFPHLFCPFRFNHTFSCAHEHRLVAKISKEHSWSYSCFDSSDSIFCPTHPRLLFVNNQDFSRRFHFSLQNGRSSQPRITLYPPIMLHIHTRMMAFCLSHRTTPSRKNSWHEHSFFRSFPSGEAVNSLQFPFLIPTCSLCLQESELELVCSIWIHVWNHKSLRRTFAAAYNS